MLEGFSLSCSWINLITFPAAFAYHSIPSSVRTMMAISVLSPSAKLRKEASCFVFVDHLGSVALSVLFLSSEEFDPKALSWAFVLYLEP